MDDDSDERYMDMDMRYGCCWGLDQPHTTRGSPDQPSQHPPSQVYNQIKQRYAPKLFRRERERR